MSAATGPLPERVPVLVVDDDEIVRTWVKHSLDESEFYVLDGAESAAEAERMLESSHPALLLVDYRLPDVDGIELVRRLRGRGVTTPAVLMTAATQAGLNHAAVEAGFQGAYVKSGRRDPLLEALRLAKGGDPAFDHRNAAHSNGDADGGILDLVTRGFTTSEVAARTGISAEAAREAFQRASGKIHRRRESLRPVPDPEPAPPPTPSKDLAYTERAAVLAAFLRSVGETVDGLRRECADLQAAPPGTASGEALATYAHTLKGGASTAGLEDVAALAAQLEATAETLPLGTDELRRLAVVSRELDVRIDRLPAPDTVGLAVRPRRTSTASTVATVAYVDDDPASLKLVEVLLAREPGFRLVTARSGHDGVAAIERERPDLVFLDLRLPDLDGLEVLERLRALERGEELPIVLLTGEAGGRLASLQQAADLVLTKPLDLGRFFEIVALLRDEAATP
jgi:CheY-like chemotaxis protein/HPt (histidine-containing phosphotransfer) domain-containing protein